MKAKAENILFDSLKYLFLLFVVVVTLYPFLNVMAIAFNDAYDTMRGGVTIFPRRFSLDNFINILKTEQVWTAFMISFFRVIINVVTTVFFSAMVAYTISRKEFVFRRIFSLIYILTMYVGGGLIPAYFLMRALGMVGTFHVYWVPGLVTAWNLIMIRTFIKTVPESLVESARMDGTGEFTIFLRIILPLIIPVLACIALFTAVGSWNNWFTTYLYNSNIPELSTIQYELMKKIQSASAAVGSMQEASSRAASMAEGGENVTPRSIRAAMTIVSSLPIIMVYPFLQRYFITGLTIGGVKE